MAIKIYADAGSNLFPEIIEKRGLLDYIKVVNMHLQVGDHEYNCYNDPINVDDFSKIFYSYLEDPKIDVHTSLVNPGDFLNAFKDDIDAGNQIICFTMAKGISGTYNSACVAANEVNESAGKTVVHVIDSATAGLGEGRQAIKAAELARDGMGFEEIVDFCRNYRWKVRSEFTVNSISFLAKTGRVKPWVARIADVLGIKAMLRGSYESNIELYEKVRGRKMALKSLADIVVRKIVDPDKQIIYLTHCNCIEDAETVKRLILEKINTTIEIYHYDFVTGSHVGPGTVAIFYEGNDRN
ncbi:MAG: DegV family protein [Erysipelotrichaceae bacterium]|jgi:DegV family protein with EDD domain|nr:DegV family protein [Erysipelotrichaceae bacterium]